MSSAPRTAERLVLAAALALLLLAAAACATTRQTREVKKSGFLADYSQLRPGVGDEALLIYLDEDADWERYDAILLDSVTIWHDEDTDELSEADQQRLTDLLYSDLHDALSQDFHMVQQPGPNVLRMRVALTEAKGANVVGNTLTTVVPQARLLSMVTGLATDTQVWVGKAAVEAEIVDSMTGTRLMAAVDQRAGAKTLRGLGGKWADVDNAFKYWAGRVRDRLQTLRGS